MADQHHRSFNEDLEQDRRLIMKKIQQHRRSQAIRQSMSKKKVAAGGDGDGDDNSAIAAAAAHSGLTERSSYTLDATDDGMDEDDVVDILHGGDDYYLNDSLDEDLRSMKAAHEQDEQLIGGLGHDGDENEGLEAMNQALTSPPVAWWAMRKQWQKRRGTMLNFVQDRLGVGGDGAVDAVGGGDEEEIMMGGEGADASYRSTSSATARRLGLSSASDAGVVGHPVMLEDPTNMGYDTDAFRQHPFAASADGRGNNNSKNKRTPTVLYVSRDVIQKRKVTQMMYIIAAICVVFLFMFILEQRKLSHYAMVGSPISLDAYLAGEALMSDKDGDGTTKKKVTLNDLGLKEFEKVHGVQMVDFSNIEVDPNDPLVNEELVHDAMVGDGKHTPHDQAVDDFSLIHGTDRFELLKGVVVGWSVTPSEIFDNTESPQYKALSWMAHEDILRYTPDNDHWIKKIIQRYTLATIYYATNGPGWTNTLFFLSNFDECNWNRVYQKYFTGAGHCDGGYITALALWGNNLSGALPPEIGTLSSLRTFSLFDNKINMPPPESLAKLKNLSRMYLQRNDFRGDINFLCPTSAREFKADCGKKGGVKCSCCTACGWNAKNDRGNMIDNIK